MLLLDNYKPCPVEDRRLLLKTGKMIEVDEDNKIISLPEYKRLSLSPSKMLVWDECKAKFRAVMLQEVRDGGSIYTAIGTAAHYVVEQLNKGEELTSTQREDLLRMKLIEECSKATPKIPLNFPPGYSESLRTIQSYEIPKGWKFVQGETLQQLEFADFTFRFVVDAIFMSEDEKTLYIIDYKTSSAPPKNPLQLLLYAWGVSCLKPEWANKTIKSAYWMLRKGNLVYHEASREVVEQVDRMMQTQVELMGTLFEANYFPEKPGSGCHFCNLTSCPVRADS